MAGYSTRWANPQLNSRIACAPILASGVLRSAQHVALPADDTPPRWMLTDAALDQVWAVRGRSLDSVNLKTCAIDRYFPYAENGTCALLSEGRWIYSRTSQCLSLSGKTDYLPWANPATRLLSLNIDTTGQTPMLLAAYQNYGWRGALDNMNVYVLCKAFDSRNCESQVFEEIRGLSDLSPVSLDGRLLIWFAKHVLAIDRTGKQQTIARRFAQRSLSVLESGDLAGILLEDGRSWLAQMALDGAERWKVEIESAGPLIQPPVCLGDAGLALVRQDSVIAWKAGSELWRRQVSEASVVSCGPSILVRSGPSLFGWNLAGEDIFEFREPEGRPLCGNPAVAADGRLIVATETGFHILEQGG